MRSPEKKVWLVRRMECSSRQNRGNRQC
uniref:Uncharacterized protein n=1 Tax=Arundo donax TaxID=35708 RepID=A0A0A8Z5S7_ARUDO